MRTNGEASTRIKRKDSTDQQPGVGEMVRPPSEVSTGGTKDLAATREMVCIPRCQWVSVTELSRMARRDRSCPV